MTPPGVLQGSSVFGHCSLERSQQCCSLHTCRLPDPKPMAEKIACTAAPLPGFCGHCRVLAGLQEGRLAAAQGHLQRRGSGNISAGCLRARDCWEALALLVLLGEPGQLSWVALARYVLAHWAGGPAGQLCWFSCPSKI